MEEKKDTQSIKDKLGGTGKKVILKKKSTTTAAPTSPKPTTSKLDDLVKEHIEKVDTLKKASTSNSENQNTNIDEQKTRSKDKSDDSIIITKRQPVIPQQEKAEVSYPMNRYSADRNPIISRPDKKFTPISGNTSSDQTRTPRTNSPNYQGNSNYRSGGNSNYQGQGNSNYQGGGQSRPYQGGGAGGGGQRPYQIGRAHV